MLICFSIALSCYEGVYSAVCLFFTMVSMCCMFSMFMMFMMFPMLPMVLMISMLLCSEGETVQ